jgi:hypothetical protein
MEEDEDESYHRRQYEAEMEAIQSKLAEYRHTHLELRCIELGIKIPGVNPDYSDMEPYQIELEKLGWDLVELGAGRECDSVEAANEAIIAKHQKVQGKR